MNQALYGCILPQDLNPTDLCDVGAIPCRAIRRRETKNLTHQGYRLPDLSRFLHDPKLPGKESGDCTKVCCRFVRGWRDYIQDPSAANAEIAKRNPEMNVERMKFSWNALKEGGFVYGSDSSGALVGKFDPQRWNENYQILRSLGVITKDIDPSRGYTLEFTKGL
jgi:hypothetical protein